MRKSLHRKWVQPLYTAVCLAKLVSTNSQLQRWQQWEFRKLKRSALVGLQQEVSSLNVRLLCTWQRRIDISLKPLNCRIYPWARKSFSLSQKKSFEIFHAMLKSRLKEKFLPCKCLKSGLDFLSSNFWAYIFGNNRPPLKLFYDSVSPNAHRSRPRTLLSKICIKLFSFAFHMHSLFGNISPNNIQIFRMLRDICLKIALHVQTEMWNITVRQWGLSRRDVDTHKISSTVESWLAAGTWQHTLIPSVFIRILSVRDKRYKKRRVAAGMHHGVHTKIMNRKILSTSD